MEIPVQDDEETVLPQSFTGDTRPTLLIVEDDRRVGEYLFRMISTLGYRIDIAESFESALSKAHKNPPDNAIVDERIPGGHGTSLIRPFRDLNTNMRIFLCTAYPSIAHTVEAMRLGATDYLSKPITPEQLSAAFAPNAAPSASEDELTPTTKERRMFSLARARWEYINMVLNNCDGNVASAARHLGIHRQSLQRMLKKVPPVD